MAHPSRRFQPFPEGERDWTSAAVRCIVAPMKNRISFLLLVVISVSPLWAAEWESLPSDSYFAAYRLLKAPPSEGRLLKQGDRLAICGDSITEQKMYSRIMETYLTVLSTGIPAFAPAWRWCRSTRS